MAIRSIVRRAAAAALVAGVLALAGGGAANAAVPGAAGAAAPLSAVRGDANSFDFTSYHGDFTLGRDSAGHSTLSTVETFVAQFPAGDQNHGIQRAIPEKYDGHPTEVNIVSVTDGAGHPRSFTTDSQSGLLLVTVADANFVHGAQTYEFTYTQTNVTKFFADTNDDEFYWDTNGTAWKQPFTSATATVHVPAALASNLTGKNACYRGVTGSTNTCDIQVGTDSAAGGSVVTTASQALGIGENVTVVVGFTAGTFTARDDSFFASGAAIAELVFVTLAVLAAVGAMAYRLTALKDGAGRPTIIAEYTPPKGVNLLLASAVYKQSDRAPAASFVSLAVRGNIQIVEQQNDGRGAKTYWLRLVGVQGLDDTELALARVLFGDTLTPGAWKQLERHDTALSSGISSLVQSTKRLAVTEGYVRGGVGLFSGLFVVAAVVMAGLAFFMFTLAVNGDYGGAVPYVLLALAALSVVVAFVAGTKKPLTPKGAELRDYIKGLELYIRLAEKDRFAMLQSPEGALKTQVSAPDRGQVVKIYEKLLPYAVLLNLETEWSQVLGTYYENLGTQPAWYGGNVGAFNAAFFVASIGSLSNVVDSSLAASTQSSSFGGSGGGGFSGGGGGGGGGGGV
ncbi:MULTISPECIES: DUF2207 domain-containing protein [Subtercola]|uniref:DUF2207 domain-containing protein n=1 Tax=Subtercola vilae TaxID=2056433 RepID=A0A4T2C3T1_9MICO|nr:MULTISPECIES: DUF2207 domain-containing protein [Subtercola]MEA9984069.1 DUF2207 domain-containing protein [Subtercola sp. RTI3]TIH38707.1 DUF2207 domain-containing protein [Subtercola vilae]